MIGPSRSQLLGGTEATKDWESAPTIDVIPEAIPLEVKPGQKQDRLNDTQDYLAMAREILKKSGRNPSP